MLKRAFRSLRSRVVAAKAQQFSAIPDGKSPLRIAVQGLGTFGKVHAGQLVRSNYFDLVGICSRSAENGRTQDQFGCDVFRSLNELFEHAKPDVVVIATPHLQHRDSIVIALENDVHVISEKPMVVHASELESIQAAADTAAATITVMSQTRFEPSYLKVRQLLDAGEIGQLVRCSLTETFLRSDNYYSKQDWRGTWGGEGGGVLVNQAPHVLDRYRWFCGCPTSVLSSCKTLRHDIEVEDSATLICHHDNGLLGTIHVSTNEPAQSRLELIGDLGSILVDEGAITIKRWSRPISECIRENHSLASQPAVFQEQGGNLLGWSESLLHDFYENFAESIWNHSAPMVPLQEAIDVVQMINAAQISEWQDRAVTIPVRS